MRKRRFAYEGSKPHAAINFLLSNGPAELRDLAEHMKVPSQRVGSFLGALVDEGVIARGYFLTPYGRKVLLQAGFSPTGENNGKTPI